MNKIASILLILVIGLAAFTGFRHAQDSRPVSMVQASENKTSDTENSVTHTPKLTPAEMKTHLEKQLPGIEVDSVEQSPLKDFYQVFYSGQLLYIDKQGKHIFNGNLLKLDNGVVDLSEAAVRVKEQQQAPMRKQIIDAIPESEMVVYKAPDEKYKMTVFTDVDCAYCRKLHREMAQLNAKGITVRYLAFPRAGIGSSAYDKLVGIWCAEDRRAAMDKAKLERKFEYRKCENPVAKQYQLTRQFNLSGTPALILEDGELITGYVPGDELLKYFQQKSGS